MRKMKKRLVMQIRRHSNYSREIYRMYKDEINTILSKYPELREEFVKKYPKARFVRIAVAEEPLPLLIEFTKNDKFRGFTIGIGKDFIRV